MKACVVIIGIAVVSVVAIATTYNYKTYVVRVDNATGQVDTGGQLKSTNYVPQQAEIKHFLGQFILDTRTVPLDPVLFKNNIDRSQHFMTREASTKMASMLKSEDETRQDDDPAGHQVHSAAAGLEIDVSGPLVGRIIFLEWRHEQ